MLEQPHRPVPRPPSGLAPAPSQLRHLGRGSARAPRMRLWPHRRPSTNAVVTTAWEVAKRCKSRGELVKKAETATPQRVGSSPKKGRRSKLVYRELARMALAGVTAVMHSHGSLITATLLCAGRFMKSHPGRDTISNRQVAIQSRKSVLLFARSLTSFYGVLAPSPVTGSPFNPCFQSPCPSPCRFPCPSRGLDCHRPTLTWPIPLPAVHPSVCCLNYLNCSWTAFHSDVHMASFSPRPSPCPS